MRIPRSFDKLRTGVARLGNGKPIAGLSVSPDKLLGELFEQVQLGRVHMDGKTFVDSIPNDSYWDILRAYDRERRKPDFTLQDFLKKYFRILGEQAEGYKSNPNNTLEEHILELWDVLERSAPENVGSLLALPEPYVVPGGRFREMFYWDSYFIMLGLAASERWVEVEEMLENCAYMINKLGFVPNGNRTYLATRSQPPFFSHMVMLLAEHNGEDAVLKYLPEMVKEYAYWMDGALGLSDRRRVRKATVRVQDGSILNRYYDSESTPRPESYKEDIDTASKLPPEDHKALWQHLRYAAASGWDFSSRWQKGATLETAHTGDILPVDLNALLVHLEQTISYGYQLKGRKRSAARYADRAANRTDAINKYCWDEKAGFYFDYDWRAEERKDIWSMAAVFPLYTEIAPVDRAKRVLRKLRRDFLQPGGLVTTLTKGVHEQWDWPNGWAPFQWVGVLAARHYDEQELAGEIKNRWLVLNTNRYKQDGKQVEKENVVDLQSAVQDGEYPLQDGFGWTNAVNIAFIREYYPDRTRIPKLRQGWLRKVARLIRL